MQGHLRLGDEWKAITVIARSQPNPLKAVAELVENAIDAQASRIVIVRGKRGNASFLSVVDNGNGLRLDHAGEPDFNHVATHICDSLKQGLPAAERQRVQGEFGIGLLGFWTLGQSLHMVARNAAGEAREMVMHEGEQSYSAGRPVQPDLLESRGVEVTVTHLHPTTRHLLTGEKIRRFLSVELRDRIRQHQVRVEIQDRMARKDLLVIPHRFEGERVARVQKIVVPGHGFARVELYYNATRNAPRNPSGGRAVPDDGAGAAGDGSPSDRGRHRVWLARNGTRVVDDIGRVPGCERTPWTLDVFEGIIDFPALTPAPGSRHGVVQDAAYAALVKELDAVADDLEDLLARRTREVPAEMTREVAREVRRVLTDALHELPVDAYEAFRALPDPRQAEPLVEAARKEAAFDLGEGLQGGPLHRARVQPVHVHVPAGRERSICLVAEDEHGRPAGGELSCSWKVLDGPAAISRTDGHRAWFHSEVRVTDGERSLTVLFNGTVVEPGRVPGRPRSLPSYELVPDSHAAWRSRFAAERNAILINSHHPDFAWSQTDNTSQLRYLTMLYCKELVAHNFADAAPEDLLDRFVELSSRIRLP
jgi:histidine kinase/DNA gyrase B/HSP90-like ATPase